MRWVSLAWHRCVSVLFSLSILLHIPFSHPCFLIFAGGSNDEGLDGPLLLSGNGGRVSKGEGGGDGGGVGGAEDLEGGLGK